MWIEEHQTATPLAELKIQNLTGNAINYRGAENRWRGDFIHHAC
jgi:hypothetical protein